MMTINLNEVLGWWFVWLAVVCTLVGSCSLHSPLNNVPLFENCPNNWSEFSMFQNDHHIQIYLCQIPFDTFQYIYFKNIHLTPPHPSMNYQKVVPSDACMYRRFQPFMNRGVLLLYSINEVKISFLYKKHQILPKIVLVSIKLFLLSDNVCRQQYFDTGWLVSYSGIKSLKVALLKIHSNSKQERKQKGKASSHSSNPKSGSVLTILKIGKLEERRGWYG